MVDLVVTVPKGFWKEWIDEGDAAGDPETGEEWGYYVGWRKPPIGPGDRLYIVAHGKLRGYAPVTRVVCTFSEYKHSWAICRKGNAVAVTIKEPIQGFRGFRKIWWNTKDEHHFPKWEIP